MSEASKSSFGDYTTITIKEREEFLNRRLHELEGQHYALTVNQEELAVETSLLDDREDDRYEKSKELLDELDEQIKVTEAKIAKIRNIAESLR